MRPARKRELVNGVRSDWGVSIRRACRVLEMDTSTYHYKSRRRGQADILRCENDHPPGDELRVFTGLQHTCQVVQAGGRIGAAQEGNLREAII